MTRDGCFEKLLKGEVDGGQVRGTRGGGGGACVTVAVATIKFPWITSFVPLVEFPCNAVISIRVSRIDTRKAQSDY